MQQFEYGIPKCRWCQEFGRPKAMKCRAIEIVIESKDKCHVYRIVYFSKFWKLLWGYY